MDKIRLDNAIKASEVLIKNLEKRNIASEVIENTLYDLERRRLRYLNNEGKEGLYESDEKWLKPLLSGNMISLDSFRFQVFPFDREEIERSGFDHMPMSQDLLEKFPQGMLCINVHIPDGADLSDELIFDKAEAFFKAHFPEYDFKYFIIRSWLVYRPMKAILNQDSRISKFMDHFVEELSSHTNQQQALDKIFGCHDLDIIKEKTSSLMKCAYENTDKFGVSFSSRIIQ